MSLWCNNGNHNSERNNPRLAGDEQKANDVVEQEEPGEQEQEQPAEQEQ